MTDCHVKFFHMRNVKKLYQIEKVLHMINVEQNVFCGETWINVLSQNLFCRNLRCFVAKSVLLQFFALLCGEKLNQKLCLWRKKDKYPVWANIYHMMVRIPVFRATLLTLNGHVGLNSIHIFLRMSFNILPATWLLPL